ncbi:hypothetical protein ACO0R3_002066 [Hanseniaspora guilliermondii]
MHIPDALNLEGSTLKKEKSAEIISYSHNHNDTVDNAANFTKHNSTLYMEPLRGKQKRPKFLLDFKIHGLSNIPLFDEKSLEDAGRKGVCYLKWQITSKKPDDNGTVHNHNIFNKGKTSKNNIIYMRDYEALKFFTDLTSNNGHKNINLENMSREELEKYANSFLPKNDHMHPSGTNPGMYKIVAENEYKGSTKRKAISNNNCQFDYQPSAPTILKFNIDETIINNSSKRERSKITRNLNPEYLIIECFSEILEHKDKSSLNKAQYRKTALGMANDDRFSMKNSPTQISTSDTISVTSLNNSLVSSDVLDNGNHQISDQCNKFKVVSRQKLGSVNINLKDYISEEESWQTHNFLLKESKINSVLKFSCHLKLIRGTYNDFDLSDGMSSNQMPATLPKLYENKTHISEKFKEKQHLDRYRRDSTVSTEDSSSSTSYNGLQRVKTNEYNDKKNIYDIPMRNKRENQNNLQATAFLNSPLLNTMKYKNYETNYLRNPYEYINPKDCIKDILDGKSGWNIDAIFTQPLEQTVNNKENKQKSNYDFLELEKMLNKYGSTKSADSTLKEKRNKSFGSTPNTKYKTTGGWLFNSVVQKKNVNNEVNEYPVNEIWDDYDDKLV